MAKRRSGDENFNIGSWIVKQKYNKPKLNEEQIIRLNSIGMIWNNTHKEKWLLKLSIRCYT